MPMAATRPRAAAAPATVTARTAVAAGVGITVAIAVVLFGRPGLAAMGGWDSASLVYVGWTWLALRGMDAATTARLARRETPGRPVADALLLGASVASLAAVGSVLVRAGTAAAGGRVLLTGLGVVTVVLSWTVVHTVFALRYARLYYGDTGGAGIDFNSDEPPTFRDFAYLAFTVGMTFQVSDTQVVRSDVRAAVLRQALLSYLFGTVIIAVTINLVAGLTR